MFETTTLQLEPLEFFCLLILVKQSVKKILDHLGLGAAFKLIKFAVFFVDFSTHILGFACLVVGKNERYYPKWRINKMVMNPMVESNKSP